MALEITELFIMLWSVICLESIILLYVLWKTPAMTFISASIFKRNIMYLVGKDRSGEFKTFKRKFGGAHIKKEGIYSLTENSHTLENKSKVPIYHAFRDMAATLDLQYPAIIQDIREKGIKITNIDDLTNLIENIKKGVMSNIQINVKPLKTFPLHDLQNMFPYNLDPTFIDAQVQGELNKFSKIMGAAPLAIGAILTLLVVAAIAVFIIQRAFQGTMSPDDCSAMVQAAKCSVSAAQNIINTTAVVG